MIGIFGTVFSYLIQIQQLVVRSETTQKRLLETITRLNPSNPISEVILKYGLKQMHLGYNKGFKVGAEDFWELWIDCLYRTKSTWKGLSLTDSWECAISSQGRDFEKFKILKECSIKRVFIQKEVSGTINVNDLVKEQKANGIKAKSINERDLLKAKYIKDNFKITKTLDFAIIDDKWVMLVYLHRNKKVNYAVLSDDDRTLKACKIIFEESYKCAN